jgi:hypothetical protein
VGFNGVYDSVKVEAHVIGGFSILNQDSRLELFEIGNTLASHLAQATKDFLRV